MVAGHPWSPDLAALEPPELEALRPLELKVLKPLNLGPPYLGTTDFGPQDLEVLRPLDFALLSLHVPTSLGGPLPVMMAGESGVAAMTAKDSSVGTIIMG